MCPVLQKECYYTYGAEDFDRRIHRNRLRPFRHGWFHCPEEENVDTPQNWPKALISCLIPPGMWIFLLLLDGEYFACARTDWQGVYIFDEEFNRSWCKPLNNNTVYFPRFISSINFSQFFSYIWITLFSVLAIGLVGVYDCCTSGKCDYCPFNLLCCCGRRVQIVAFPSPSRPTDSHSGGNGERQENVELQERQ